MGFIDTFDLDADPVAQRVDRTARNSVIESKVIIVPELTTRKASSVPVPVRKLRPAAARRLR